MSTETTPPVVTINDKEYKVSDLSEQAIGLLNTISRANAKAMELQADLAIHVAGQQALSQALLSELPQETEEKTDAE